MAWSTDMVTMLRILIDDYTSPYTYDNTRLQTLIAVAGQLVQTELTFDNTYTIDVSVPSITPDPVTAADDAFINLTVLKAACILSMSESRTAASKGMLVKDGPSTIDARDMASSKSGVAEDYCEAYQKAKKDYQAGNSSAGQAVVGPYNIGMAESGR